jgi:hypothetical protein
MKIRCILAVVAVNAAAAAVQFEFVARHYYPAGYADANTTTGVPDL